MTAGRSSGGAATRRRATIARRLGLEPGTGDVLRFFLDAALPTGGAVVLDAGCGRVSALVPFRSRIAELVGVDIRTPDPPPPWLDRFVQADLCTDHDAFAPATFDTILSSFTIEHFSDPPAAFRTLAGWLRPGGTLVVTTVNRANPFVRAYLSLPRTIGGPLQRFVKAGPGDAHRLVGRCNTPGLLRAALESAGLERIEIVTTDHLAQAWSRRLPTFVAGLAGDLVAHPFPARRSTIVARASRPG